MQTGAMLIIGWVLKDSREQPAPRTIARPFEDAARPSGVGNVEKIPGTGGLVLQSHTPVIRIATASTTNANSSTID